MTVQDKKQKLHDWSLAKIKRLYNPKGNEGWLTVHLQSVINQAFRMGFETACKQFSEDK